MLLTCSREIPYPQLCEIYHASIAQVVYYAHIVLKSEYFTPSCQPQGKEREGRSRERHNELSTNNGCPVTGTEDKLTQAYETITRDVGVRR